MLQLTYVKVILKETLRGFQNVVTDVDPFHNHPGCVVIKYKLTLTLSNVAMKTTDLILCFEQRTEKAIFN